MEYPNIEETDRTAEAYMRRGAWHEAEDLYRTSGLYEPSEITLRTALLHQRHACVRRAESVLAALEDGMDIQILMDMLTASYDEFTAAWTLHEYEGILLAYDGFSWRAERKE